MHKLVSFFAHRKAKRVNGSCSCAGCDTCQETDKVLNGNFVSSVVNLDVLAVEIQVSASVVVDCGREDVTRVAGDIIGQHHDDI
jgi:hypothetical protein